MPASRTLLFGGSFDPIHHGHLIVARCAAELLQVDQVVLVPSAHPPHKPDQVLAPAADRVEMCRLAVESDPLFRVDDWETRQSGPSYTLLTVRHFREQLPADAWLGWLIGADSLIELPTWHRVGELAELCTLVTAARPGFSPPDLREHAQLIAADRVQAIREHILGTPRVEISASEIRARCRTGRSIRWLTPAQVVEYIGEHALYRGV